MGARVGLTVGSGVGEVVVDEEFIGEEVVGERVTDKIGLVEGGMGSVTSCVGLLVVGTNVG